MVSNIEMNDVKGELAGAVDIPLSVGKFYQTVPSQRGRQLLVVDGYHYFFEW